MIYLIDRVLPESFFANNLRALFVDMAVFRDLMRLRLPRLSRHLDRLRATSPSDHNSGKLYVKYSRRLLKRSSLTGLT